MSKAVKAGAAYFAVVFAVGFALGILRILVLVPLVGEVAGVVFELPLMLALSWFASRWLVARFALPAGTPRLHVGGLAFALLMAAEFSVSVLVFGRSPAEHWATYRMVSAQLGLLAQVLFAVMPLLVRAAVPPGSAGARLYGASARQQLTH